jgi:hypothetical protein
MAAGGQRYTPAALSPGPTVEKADGSEEELLYQPGFERRPAQPVWVAILTELSRLHENKD